MSFLHSEVYLGSGERVRIDLDRQANVRMLDDYNFRRYRDRESYSFHGGRALRSPLILGAPSPGRWHVVIEGPVRAAVTKLS